MNLLEALKTMCAVAGIVCATTPIWYMPYRRLIERLGLSKYRSGRIRRATLTDWLGATGLGCFGATVFLVVAQYLRAFES